MSIEGKGGKTVGEGKRLIHMWIQFEDSTTNGIVAMDIIRKKTDVITKLIRQPSAPCLSEGSPGMVLPTPGGNLATPLGNIPISPLLGW